MKRHMRVLCNLTLLAVSLPDVVAQGNQPSQPIDPTAQAPATRAPATPHAVATPIANPRKDRSDLKVYVGAIVKDGDAYVLKSGNEKYLLDGQRKAKDYNGRDVKITGTL